MAVMAKWGTKQWAVSSSKVLALEGLTLSYAQAAEDNTSTQDKKTTNEKGMELISMSFSTVLHSGVGVDVRAEIEAWQELVTKVNDFYLGGKKLGPKFQLRKVSVADVKLDNLGRMRLATLNFDFVEYQKEASSIASTSSVTTSAKAVKPTASDKTTKATKTIKAQKYEKKTPKVGSYVTITATKYATGEKIPAWVKKKTHKIGQIKGNKVLLGKGDGINSWVYTDGISLK